VTWLLVALGAAVGAPLRYVLAHRYDGRLLPHGTVLANWAGSLLLGLFTGLGLSGDELALLGTGFCGALTTYSSFAVQTHDRGRVLGSVTAVVTLVPALLLCAAGFWAGAQA